MKRIIGLVILLLVVNSQSFAQKVNEKFAHFSGSNWEKYEGHKLSIVVADTSVAGTRVLVEQIIKDGKFDAKINLSAPQNAYFGMYTPNGDYVYKQEFVAEPTTMKFERVEATNGLNVVGGKYNTLFLGLKKDPEYIRLTSEFQELTKNATQADFENEDFRKKYTDLQQAISVLQKKKFDDLRFNHPDPVVRLIAIQHSNRSPKHDQQLTELEKELGEYPELIYLKYSSERAKKKKAMKVPLHIGSTISNFEGKDLQGNSIQLSEIMSKNKYTLVEFWASWCVPCRGEIPHMKKAYEQYKEKGFEILSFTLDHDTARWEKASKEENLPWINIGDLLAFKSPVVNTFGISAIPANYLIDSTGKIVAVDLRQNALDSKLSELLK